jgi:hypothetical protein
MTDSIPQQAGPGAGADEQLRSALAALVSDPIVQGMSARISNQANEDGRPDPLAVARAALAVEDSRERCASSDARMLTAEELAGCAFRYHQTSIDAECAIRLFCEVNGIRLAAMAAASSGKEKME